MQKKKLIVAGYTVNHYIFYEYILSLFKGYDSCIYTNRKTLTPLKELASRGKSPFRARTCIPFIFRKDAVALVDEPYGICLLAYLSLQCLAGKKFYLIVHNYNKWFHPEKNYNRKPGLFEQFKRRLRKGLVNRLEHFIFVSSTVTSSARNAFPGKNFYFIPFCFSPAAKRKNSANRCITVSVPGVVSRRRNYKFIIQAISHSEIIKNNMRFLFLGRPSGTYGKEMFLKLSELKNNGFNILVSKQFIPDSAYREHLENSGLLLSVFNTRFVTSDHYSEYYGETKETGIAPLALSFALPLITPEGYHIPDEIAGQVVKAVKTPSELTEILEKIITEPGFLSPYRQNAEKNNKAFCHTNNAGQFKPLR